MARAALLSAALVASFVDLAGAVRQVTLAAKSTKEENATLDAKEEEAENEERSLLTAENYPFEKGPYRQQQFLMPGLVNQQYVQQFKVKEDNHFITKEYKVKLEELEQAGYSGREVQKHLDVKDLVHIDPHFFTLHRASTLTLQDFNGNERKLLMAAPHIINKRWSWRVTPEDDPENVLFTIQKRLWNDHCKFWIFKCKAIWKIYEGHKGDKSTLIYYGVDDADDQDEPDFKFYHSEQDYKENKKQWVARIDHKKHAKSDQEDQYKVKVQPGEDAALILVATACVDAVADYKRPAEDDEDHHEFGH